ncbi:Dolichyl-diphosphooligosaccharide-protein glycosyltransferase 48kDa subunit [Xylariaceae sp. FL0255]|nr:Dolichyl-diphosphooligosaccharide-protein glycosyltransferase 48kDa subunit [Xylariaceae sp. FL0255]
MRSLITLALMLLVAVASAMSAAGSRLLVIMDDVVADKATYSKFIADLEGRGFSITYETPKSEHLNLFHLGERTYDHLLLLPTKAKGLGPNLTANTLLNFLNADGNILVTLTGTQAVPTALNSLLLELDIQLSTDRLGLVVDHFNYDVLSAPDQHDVLALRLPGPIRSGSGDFFGRDQSVGRLEREGQTAESARDLLRDQSASGGRGAPDSSQGAASSHQVGEGVAGAIPPISKGSGDSRGSKGSGGAGGVSDQSVDGLLAFPRGCGQTLGQSPLLTPVLRAPSTAYSYNPKEQGEVLDDLFASGAQLSLVSTLQARNSARFTVVGSAEMLSDKWFDAKVKKAGEKDSVKTLNRDFAKAVSGWTFKETGVLRVNWIEHHLNEVGAGNETNPKIYRIKNDVTYSISLSEFSWDHWVPFIPPVGDELQLEFSMLSPFYRLRLNPTAYHENSATYSVSFKLPDQHGIFNFLVNYKRPFFTNVFEKNTVSVRHFAHDEWPRSFVISGAWPWIAGIGATITGWLGFCAVWLYSAPPKATKESKKTR